MQCSAVRASLSSGLPSKCSRYIFSSNLPRVSHVKHSCLTLTGPRSIEKSSISVESCSDIPVWGALLSSWVIKSVIRFVLLSSKQSILWIFAATSAEKLSRSASSFLSASFSSSRYEILASRRPISSSNCKISVCQFYKIFIFLFSLSMTWQFGKSLRPNFEQSIIRIINDQRENPYLQSISRNFKRKWLVIDPIHQELFIRHLDMRFFVKFTRNPLSKFELKWYFDPWQWR